MHDDGELADVKQDLEAMENRWVRERKRLNWILKNDPHGRNRTFIDKCLADELTPRDKARILDEKRRRALEDCRLGDHTFRKGKCLDCGSAEWTGGMR